MAEPKPHYFPAAVIGGFGQQHAGQPPREAFVCVRRLTPAPLLQRRIRAKNVAAQRHIYDVQESCQDLAADYADRLWERYEGALPTAIAATAACASDTRHWPVILAHLRALAVRHPDFERFATVHLHKGVAPADPDTIQRDRLRTLDEAEGWMAESRIAVVHRGAGAERLIVNDKGYAILEEEHRPGVRGLFVPLCGDVAVLAVSGTAQADEDHRSGPFAQRTLNRRGVRRVNEAVLRQFGITCVIGHPEDADRINRLGRHMPKPPRLGPYCSNREHGMFNWALR